MKKLLFLGILCTNLLLAIDMSYFNNTFEKVLRKDQQMYIVIKENKDEKLLVFRWTLFHNNGLVTLLNYNGEPTQHLLYKRYHEDSIKLEIASRQNETARFHPYIIITFLGYNYENKSATFQVLHKDGSGLSSIELKP